MQTDNFYYSEATKLHFKHKKWQFIKAPTPAGELVTSGIQTVKSLTRQAPQQELLFQKYPEQPRLPN